MGAGISYLLQVGVNALQNRANPWTENISWPTVVAGAVSGGVGGIAFTAANVGWKTAAAAAALNGVVAGRVGRMTENVLSGQDLLANFGEWELISDATLGGVFGAAGAGLGSIASKFHAGIDIVEYEPTLHRKAWQTYNKNANYWAKVASKERGIRVQSMAKELNSYVTNFNRAFDESVSLPNESAKIYLAMQNGKIRGAIHVNFNSTLPAPFPPLPAAHINLLDAMGGRKGVGTELLKWVSVTNPHDAVYLSAADQAITFYRRFVHEQRGSDFVFWGIITEIE